LRIRAVLAALSVAGASFALFAPQAHAAAQACVHINIQVDDQGQGTDVCLPPA